MTNEMYYKNSCLPHKIFKIFEANSIILTESLEDIF